MQPTAPLTRDQFGQRLSKAWELRRTLDLEGALVEFLSLKGQLRLESGAFAPSDASFAALIPQYGSPGAESLAALAAAMERARGKVDESDRIVREGLAALGRYGEAGSALRFERGLNAFLRGEYTQALEDFVRVRGELARDEIGELALLNAVLCLENLGLPHARLLEELKALPSPSATVRSQVDALELRQAFRQGRFGEVLAGGRSGQSMYFAAWVSQLPYLSVGLARQERVSELLAGQGGIFLRSFRARTLQGILAPEDARVSKPSEIVDRFYLWTWRWIENGDATLLRKSLTLLARGEVFDRLDRLTREDLALLENSLLWLALFDPAPGDRAAEVARRLPRFGLEAFPLLELERLALDYLHARRAGQAHLWPDYLERLSSHPLWRHPDLAFRDIVLSVEPPAQARSAAAARIASLFREPAEPEGALRVDVAQGLIARGKKDKTISHPMAQALWTIRSETAPTLERVAEAAFGIRSFDPTVHTAKIFNLLSRIRRALPKGLNLRTRGGRVVAEGAWDRVAFVGADSARVPLARNEDWSALFATRSGGEALRRRVTVQGAAPEASASAVGIPAEMTRAELERLIDRPRSTTNRLIAGWVARGYLTARGRSRATRYLLSSEFRRLIVTKGVPR